MTGRETLHDLSLDTIKAVAEVFGCQVEVRKGKRHGPDVTIRDPSGSVVIYVESEVGHETGATAREYFDDLAKRLKQHAQQDRNAQRFIIIVTNAPRPLGRYVGKCSSELREKLGLAKGIEGLDVYIVPASLYREILPSVLSRILSTVAPGRIVIS